MKFNIKKGLKLPISGEAKTDLDLSKKTTKVALLGTDYVGMKPTMAVKEGEEVKAGQLVFSCKKNLGLHFTAPGAGKVVAINRGERRVFQSLVIELSENEEQVTFKNFTATKKPVEYSEEEARALLIESGEWKALRQRPYEKVADIEGKPASLFVTAIDTNPLAPNPEIIIAQYEEEFKAGLDVLGKLPKNKTYLCKAEGAKIPAGKAEVAEFKGLHPAGNAGTHIHFVDPVNPNKYVWHIGYQDVIAVGSLFLTGKLMKDKVVSVAGPCAKNPRYLKVRRGADLAEVLAGEIKEGAVRSISGSVFNGHKAEGAFNFLGAYSNQVSLIEEDREREFLGWHSPGFNRYSVKNIYVSKLFGSKKFNLGSSRHGSYRAIVPIGSFEKVMPLDILATPLLKALASKDTDLAQDLGCLELAEEDLALATFVAPGKTDFGPILRENLTTIEREG